MNKNFSIAWNMVKKRPTCQWNVTKTNAEMSLTTSFLAQKLLNELFVRALAGSELVLAGAELVLSGDHFEAFAMELRSTSADKLSQIFAE